MIGAEKSCFVSINLDSVTITSVGTQSRVRPKRRGVAKYSDVGHVEGYETVQDIPSGTIMLTAKKSYPHKRKKRLRRLQKITFVTFANV